MKKKLLFLIVTIFLSGCDGNNEIKKVKDHVFPEIDTSRTIGTVMEHREGCKDGRWNRDTDSSGRVIVSYSCKIDTKQINDVFNNSNNKKVAKYNEQLNYYNQEISNEKKYNAIVRSLYSTTLSNLDQILAEYKVMAEHSNPDTDESGLTTEKKERLALMKDADYESLKDRITGIGRMSSSERAAEDILRSFSISNVNSEEGINMAKEAINRIYTEYEDEIKNLYKVKIEALKEQINKKNPIDVTLAESTVYFSSNPSKEDPVSFVGIKYNIKNNGDEIVTSGGSLTNLYNGKELRVIEEFLARRYYVLLD